MAEARVQPVELDLDRTKQLRIRWSDGRDSVISLTALRKACPCAGCRANREERESNPMTVLQTVANEADLVTVEEARLVGNYALGIRWKDGHDTGIYDYALLRTLGS